MLPGRGASAEHLEQALACPNEDLFDRRFVEQATCRRETAGSSRDGRVVDKGSSIARLHVGRPRHSARAKSASSAVLPTGTLPEQGPTMFRPKRVEAHRDVDSEPRLATR